MMSGVAVKIARIALTETGDASWAVVDPQPGTATLLDGTPADWAPALLSGSTAPGRVLSLDTVRLLAPLEPTSRVFGVGANYLSHLEKLGHARPSGLVAYLKPFSAIVGPGETIRYPKVCTQLDFEIELVAVVGRPMSAHRDPTANLLGYTVGNDISDRSSMHSPIGGFDLFGMKAQDATTPVGPWIVTPDELGGPGQPELAISLRVDGEERQHDVTSQMIFSVAEILVYLDDRVALRPGDLVFTGTTYGVGLEDGRLLEPGSVVESEVQDVGVLRNVVGPRSR
jgi:2-keto-4-pentenoate hydratase/2-oxohepta-3-ene-1,7-dioic acid hydratase in catechol pathway